MKKEIREALLNELAVPVWPTAGRALGYGRNKTYDAARKGEIPGVFQTGCSYRVATAPLRRLLGLDDQAAA